MVAITMSEAHSTITMIAIFGLCNCLSTASLLAFVLYHRYYKKWSVLHSQNITLITNLIFSDFLQSLGFLIEFHWLRIGQVQTDSAACSTQGHLIQMGDLATSMFVILIAANTALHFIRPSNPNVPQVALRWVISLVWLSALLMAVVPPAFKPGFYGNAGVWCWIAVQYSWEKLYLHYIFLLLAMAVSLIIYPSLGIYLIIQSRKTDRSRNSSSTRLSTVAKTMFLYPMSYALGTMPLAITRIRSMAGQVPNHGMLMGACIVFSMLGGINCLIYIGTRKHILASQQEEIARQQEVELQRHASALQKKLALLGSNYDEFKAEAYYPGLVIDLEETGADIKQSGFVREQRGSQGSSVKDETRVAVKAIMIDDLV
ncbi:hypothetical protein BCR37DRAFT_206059 [Protomyces lactucae-debilis]|uniref:G-protein coupled receptors family 1 profile domain-containing protein n=1 Tax=Protomyces lactucae-debilis TaxID=2754530 RepID=A0A1Y2FQE7_PROLT|nr:uncharacterized protein BCR37DRAFT_206059 [Protomyces lactucae-debilis]ORY86159.1 hypothetical protein BCR37DRAFT_206059 [Protomyces lactucae-debilis]